MQRATSFAGPRQLSKLGSGVRPREMRENAVCTGAGWEGTWAEQKYCVEVLAYRGWL